MTELNIRIGGVEATKVQDVKKRISLMLWGPGGVGKTSLAATAPGKKLWLLFDPNGSSSLNYMTRESDDITVVDLSNASANIVMQGIQENPFGIEQYLKSDTFDTVVFDSATTYMDFCLKYAVMNTKGATEAVPTMAGYARKNSVLKQTLNNLIRITDKYNKHIIIIGHEDNGQMDELGNVIKQSPMIGGSSNLSLLIMLSEIWYMNLSTGKRRIYFQPFGVKSPVKSRMISQDCRYVDWNYTFDKGGNGINTWFEQWKNANSKIVPQV